MQTCLNLGWFTLLHKVLTFRHMLRWLVRVPGSWFDDCVQSTNGEQLLLAVLDHLDACSVQNSQRKPSTGIKTDLLAWAQDIPQWQSEYLLRMPHVRLWLERGGQVGRAVGHHPTCNKREYGCWGRCMQCPYPDLPLPAAGGIGRQRGCQDDGWLCM